MMLASRESHRFLLRAALSAAHLFAWVFIFHFAYIKTGFVLGALVSVFVAYALTQIVVVLLTPWAARQVEHGMRRAMVLGTLALTTAFLFLATGFLDGFAAGVGIALFALLSGLYRALYWVPYVASERAQTGHIREVILASLPLISGIWLGAFGNPVVLLYGAATLAVLSLLPLIGTREQWEGFAWGYRETFHELFAPARGRTVLGSYLDGVEGAALLLIWPLLVFLLVGWSYPLLGLVMSLGLLAAYAVRSLVGRRPPVSVWIQMAVGASAWILRLVVMTPLSIVILDTFHRGTRGVAADGPAHEQAADNHTFIDEMTALREMSLALGRLSLVLLACALALSGSAAVVMIGCCIAAALASIASVAIRNTRSRPLF